jgi:hypothetical protein
LFYLANTTSPCFIRKPNKTVVMSFNNGPSFIPARVIEEMEYMEIPKEWVGATQYVDLVPWPFSENRTAKTVKGVDCYNRRCLCFRLKVQKLQNGSWSDMEDAIYTIFERYSGEEHPLWVICRSHRSENGGFHFMSLLETVAINDQAASKLNCLFSYGEYTQNDYRCQLLK